MKPMPVIILFTKIKFDFIIKTPPATFYIKKS